MYKAATVGTLQPGQLVPLKIKDGTRWPAEVIDVWHVDGAIEVIVRTNGRVIALPDQAPADFIRILEPHHAVCADCGQLAPCIHIDATGVDWSQQVAA